MTDVYISRDALTRTLDEAIRAPYIFVVAGAGYGKTHALRSILDTLDAFVIWTSLTEHDNKTSVFWEIVTYQIARINLLTAENMRTLGFPETATQFAQLRLLASDSRLHPQPKYFVFDDFHNITDTQILSLFEVFSRRPLPNIYIIIISHTVPEMNIPTLIATNKARLITEESFRFTADETLEYLSSCGLTIQNDDINRIQSATSGWPLAVKLLGMAMRRQGRLDFVALSAMQRNIFTAIEQEVYSHLSEQVQLDLIRASLVSELPAGAYTILKTYAAFVNNPDLYAFIRFDSVTGDVWTNPLFHAFLANKQNLLDISEKNSIYRQTAAWCVDNGMPLQALTYYNKIPDYKSIVFLLLRFPLALPHAMAQFIYGELSDLQYADDDLYAALLDNTFIPRLLVDLGRFDEAEKLAAAAVAKWETSAAPFSSMLLYSSLNCLSYVKLHNCAASHVYDFDTYNIRAVEIYRSMPSYAPIIGDIGCTVVKSFACAIGKGASLDEFSQFISAIRRASDAMNTLFPGFYSGYAELAECELAFYLGHTADARRHGYTAIQKAKATNQHNIEAAAYVYLLRAAVADGDEPQAASIMAAYKTRALEVSPTTGMLSLDIMTSWLYCLINLPTLIPAWLKPSGNMDNSPREIPLWEITVHAMWQISMKRYDEAIITLVNSVHYEINGSFLLGEIILRLLLAVARHKNGDEVNALIDFEAAYDSSIDGRLEMAFLERSRDVCALASLALKRGTTHIPKPWLTAINHRAAAYAKKLTVISASFRKRMNIVDYAELTQREIQILTDLYNGLSRQEIAATRYISLNTVKSELATLYAKLGAESAIEAVRIAIERGLLSNTP
ncbi:hypothetical protein FACS18948_6740 [Clostridia bacterium]|nr:hypothetical protein FACS18948_6740 [Clostridia bacterium]